MTLQEITNALKNIKRGRITKVHYITAKGDYSKEVKGYMRLVEYSHIKQVQQAKAQNPNPNPRPNPSVNVIEPSVIYNKNTGKTYLAMATVNVKYKSQVTYCYKGNEITKQEFELANPPRPNQKPTIWFTKDIADIISIG